MHCKYRVGPRGIPELYEVFPDSHFNLIEPLQAFEGDLKRILRRYQGDYVLAAGLVVGGAPSMRIPISLMDPRSVRRAWVRLLMVTK